MISCKLRIKRLVVVLGQGLCADSFIRLASKRPGLIVKQCKLPILPLLIEDESIIPDEAKKADIVLDYTTHPDIPHLLPDAGRIFTKSLPSLPHVVSLTCFCSTHIVDIFGRPRFKLGVEDDRIKTARVLTTAPCGASYEVAKKLVGLNINQAAEKAGLFAQFYCSGKMEAIHCAAHSHQEAVREAIGLSSFIS